MAALATAGNTIAQERVVAPAFLELTDSPWVDSVFQTLTPDQRIAQLISVAAYSNRDDAHREEILRLVRDYKIGGLVFFQGGPVRQGRLINEYQQHASVPLLISIDAEWGLGMRLDSTLSFPFQMTLGAVQNDSLIYALGQEVGRQLKRAGMHLNFAPVADINNNPSNPVIGYRSFGEDADNVARKATAYMMGMQDAGILTTAKHFPGHGDTDTDSHYALPQINHTRERLDSLELVPFRRMIHSGLSGVMVAHLNIPALDESGRPSTLSYPIVTRLLKEELGFTGLVVTDAMNMRAITASFSPGVADRNAVLAGNDMLEFTEDVPRAIEEVRSAIRAGLISQAEIDRRCRKMLAAKRWVELHNKQQVEVRGLVEDLNTAAGHLLKRNLMEAAVTVVRNQSQLVPVMELDTLTVASVSIGADRVTTFQRSLSLYTRVTHYTLPFGAGREAVDSLVNKLSGYGLVIAALHDESPRPANRIRPGDEVRKFISWLGDRHHVVFTSFRNPYVLNDLEGVERMNTLILTYQDDPVAQQVAAEVVFGGTGARGRLPVSIGSKFKLGEGVDTRGGIRFQYTWPEAVGMRSEILNRGVDSLVQQALDVRAIPGCVVLVARDRKVVFHKAYGFHDYADTIRVKTTDLYDLASVTKISTGLAALMKLYDEKRFNLDATLPDYLKVFKGSNKADVPMKDILTHQAQFTPWIAFYKDMVKKNGKYRWFTVKTDSSERFPIKLKENMYLHRRYPDRIVREIRNAPQLPEKKYVYSDFFFILAPRIIESITDSSFTEYIQKHFFDRLGATTTGFNPLTRFTRKEVVPTEHDFYFRHEPIHGTVHDEGAIMLGGVSGHAGLFSNANDLAKLMQMYLDMGSYGGERFISESTLREWTSVRFPENNNRRGLGFDKPNLEYTGRNNNVARDASPASFGHTGFTGTMVWMDPETNLLYVFLSNRVLPTRNNTRLYRLNTRTEIQQVIYDALMEGTPVGNE